MCAETKRCDRVNGRCTDVVRGCERLGQSICLSSVFTPAEGLEARFVAKCAADLIGVSDIEDCAAPTPYCEAGECVAGLCLPPRMDNLLANPNFDTGFGSWRELGVSATWSDLDVTNCARSGSVTLRSAGGQQVRGLSQCVMGLPATKILYLEANVYAGTGQSARVEWQQWQGSACDGLDNGNSGAQIDGVGNWSWSGPTIELLPGTQSVEILLVPAAQPTWFDMVHLSVEP
jgi:hypothetical protein